MEIHCHRASSSSSSRGLTVNTEAVSFESEGLEPETIGSPTRRHRAQFDRHAEPPARGSVEQWMVRTSCVFSAGAALVVATRAIYHFHYDHAPMLFALAVQCFSEGVRALLVWLQFGRTCQKEGRPSALFLGAREVEDDEARAGRRLDYVSRCVWCGSCSVATFLGIASMFTFVSAALQLRNSVNQSTYFKWDADARSVDAQVAWPCFVLFGAVFVLRRVLASRLDSDLVYRASWSALMLQVVVLLLIIQDFLLDHGYIQVRSEWFFSMAAGVILMLDGLQSSVRATLEDGDLADDLQGFLDTLV